MEALTILMGLVGVLVGLLVGGVGFLVYKKAIYSKKKDEASKEADRIIHRAKSQAAKIERDAKQKAKDFETRARRNAENDIKKEKQKVLSQEKSLKDKESRLEKDYKIKHDQLDQKLADIESRKERIQIAEQRLEKLDQQAQQTIDELRSKIETVANYSTEQAKEELKRVLTDEAQQEVQAELTKIETEAKQQSKEKSRYILAQAISRFAAEVSAERTVTAIALTGEEMKGKIIGREGRNIRALEAACGVDVIIDETPDSVIISSFDPVRREVAKMTIERLMEDGRVHPARIEEVAHKVKQDIITEMKEVGEEACIELGISGVHPAILNLIGSLKFRQMGVQNLFQHSLEVAYIAGILAAEIGADVSLARRAGLLHDVGRAIDHTVIGNYAEVGSEFCKKHGEKDIIVKAIAVHEDNDEPNTLLGHLVQAANNLSKARPGARRENMENYIRRLQDMESIGNSFDGVEKTFAIQSGKEIRVIVDSSKVTDEQSTMLSRDIARKIERELNYPGQVKVAVVRETRIVEHAR